MNMEYYLVTLISLLGVATVSPKEVYYDLTVSYFLGAPDGVPIQILGFNNQFPGPTLRAKKYDILTIKVTNLIQDFQTTTIHWHGIEQYLNPFVDGPRMITQCDIPFNSSFTYQFQVNQSGTYWYHSHHTVQLGEGLWGVIIIDNDPEVYKYDGEILIVTNPWFHLSGKVMTEWYEDTPKSKAVIPFPDTVLVNGAGYYPCEYAEKKNMSCSPSYKERYRLVEVESGKTYRIRFCNPGPIGGHYLSIDGHKLELIETDGVDTVREVGIDRTLLPTGSRSSFLVKMNGELDQYWIRVVPITDDLPIGKPNINPYPEAYLEYPVLGVLRYKDAGRGRRSLGNCTFSSAEPVRNEGAVQGRPEKRNGHLLHQLLKSSQTSIIDLSHHNRVDGLTYYPNDPMDLPYATAPYPTTEALLEPEDGSWDRGYPIDSHSLPNYVNETIVIYTPFTDDPNNPTKLGFNNITYKPMNLRIPALFMSLFGQPIPQSANPVVINGFGNDYIVEMIFNNNAPQGHPLHLHGHTYWIMGRGMNTGPFVEERDRPNLRPIIRRETASVRPFGWLAIRFHADNPGVWLLHCHISFHLEAGVGLVLVEGQEIAKQIYKIPQQSVDLCRLNGIELEESFACPKPNPCQFLLLVLAALTYSIYISM